MLCRNYRYVLSFSNLGEMLKRQDALADMDPESAQDVAEARKKVEAMKSMDWSGG